MTPAEDKQLMGRVAAAIWASIGTVGFVATVGPLRTAGAHVSEMRAMAAAAALIAGIMLAIPAAPPPRLTLAGAGRRCSSEHRQPGQ